ncbi:MAG: DUF2339 domain-containing protein [Geminicoccaceae bacterium]
MNLLFLIAAGLGAFWLHHRLARLEQRLDRLEASPSRETVSDSGAAARPMPAKADMSPAKPAPPPGPWQRPADNRKTQAASSSAPPPAPLSALKPAGSGRFEEKFAQRWLVWFGAATFALGGMFLVKLAAESGFFGPGARVALALLAGSLLVIGGERLRRAPGTRGEVAAGGNFVPPALTAAGVATLFAAIWAAYALYDFIPPFLAFILLAALSVLSFLLSFLHGLFLALIGLAGGMAVPLLVQTGSASAPGLFSYLAMITASAFGVLHWMRWKSLFLTTIVAASLWVVLALFDATPHLPTTTISLFLIAMAAFGFAVPLAGERLQVSDAFWRWPRLFLGGMLAVLWMAFILFDHRNAASLDWLAAMSAIAIFMTRLRDGRSISSLLPLLAVLFALAVHDLGPMSWLADSEWVPEPDKWNFEKAVLRPLDASGFLHQCILFALIIGLLSGIFIHGAASPGLFATLSIFGPLAILILAYLRLAELDKSNIAWASAAAGLALWALAISTFARQSGPRCRGALAAAIAGVTAALALGATMTLEHGWLVTFLVTEALALVRIWQIMRLRTTLLLTPWLTTAATALAVMAPETAAIVNFGKPPAIAQILVGLALPAVLATIAACMLGHRRGPVRRVRTFFEGAALLLGMVALAHISRYLAVATGGGYLVQYGIQLTAWLTLALGIVRRGDLQRWRAVAAYGLLALSAVIALLFAGPLNPAETREAVGHWPFLNALLPAYALPAIMLALLAWQTSSKKLGLILGAAALIEGGLWAFWSIRHAFTGPLIAGAIGEGEQYAHSLALIAAAATLLLTGLRPRSLALRRAGLGVLVLAILKVFLLDLDQLEGVLRAASFMGLGLAMIGAGYAFQRWGRE